MGVEGSRSELKSECAITIIIMIMIQTLTTKDCKGPQTKYAGKRRIYKDLISKNEK